MLSDADPFLPSCCEPYQLGLKCAPDQDSSQNTGLTFQNCTLSLMEVSLSSELSAPSGLGRNQDSVNINSQAFAEGHSNDDAEELAEPVKPRPTSKEFRKTWGFRSSTIAQREMAGDASRQDSGNEPGRCSGRQARRSRKLEEVISTPRRGRGVRKSAPGVCPESPKPPPHMLPAAVPPSEASVIIGRTEGRTPEEPADDRHLLVKLPPSVSVSEGTSSDQTDSEELTLKDLQELLEKRRKKCLHSEVDSIGKEVEQNSLDKTAAPVAITEMPSESSSGGTSQTSVSTHQSLESRAGGTPIMNSEAEEEELPVKSDESHCSGKLCCICHQMYNNRFMISCDRCEEWFHGDCVGIAAACGQLLERNGADSTCPSCTVQAAATESSAGDTSSRQTGSSAAGVESHVQDQGIKGKIERAANTSEKKKIKIFQPVEEISTLPRCIGSGCGKSALPDSVYCGTACILTHAAAAMQSLTRVKEPTPKPQSQKKPPTKFFAKGQKRSLPARTLKRSPESCSMAEDDESSSKEAVVEQGQTTPLWSSDHHCITVNPEKATAIPSAVFYKSSGKESEEMERKKESPQLQLKSPHSFTFPRGNKKTPVMGDPPTKRTKLVSQPMSSAGASKNSTFPPRKCPSSRKHSPAVTPTSQASCPTTARRHASDALVLSEATSINPSKLPPAPSSAACRLSLGPAAPSKPPQGQLNLMIRHNIRRSLAEILYKRVSDSDDLDMSERDVGKLAVSIEKEMYSLFLNTDNKYKEKYKSIMFHLKEPKDKALFYQVVRGEVTPFKLVRLSPDELLSKAIAGLIHVEKAEVLEQSPKAEAGQRKRSLKQGLPPDMGESPPVSDGDACISATSSSPCIAAAPEWQDHSPRSAPVNSDVFSKMLKDTTAEHRAHLFNLNCKICTGKTFAEEEPVPKKVKSSVNKKAEPKAKQLCHKVGDYFDDDSSRAPPDSEMYVMESPASPDEPSSTVTLSEPVSIPAVPSVVIAGRDPRTASYRPPVTVTSAVPTVSSIIESRLDIAPVPLAPPPPPPPPPPPTIPKSILLKPASSSDMRFFTASGSSMMDSHSPPGGDTALFLSKQEAVWKGFLNMHSVAKFITKAYLVSGSFESLKEDLPDTIQIGGRISPDTVWDYVEKIKTSVTKELCLIRFHPATEEEEVAYISLFSYFNSRGRFGVVANNSHCIKDLYLIPLGAKAPIPSKLIPIEGPGLETNRPNLLLGLAICQKPKGSGALQSEENEDMCSKFQTGHSDCPGLSNLPDLPSADINQGKDRMYNPAVLISTTPPGSPSSVSSSDSSLSSCATSLLLQKLKAVKDSAQITTKSDEDSSSPTTASSITPLQTILKTLFGKNKLGSHTSPSPSEQNLNIEVSVAPMLDPIVLQFGQISKEKLEEDEENQPNYLKEEFNPRMGYAAEEDEDDRPYDPEEEYNPGMGYGVGEDEDDRSYDPAEEFNAGMGSGVEEDEDDKPYDPEEEYNSMIYRVEKDEDDRPYDPEEEYDPGKGYGVEPAQKIQTDMLSKTSDDEVPYDPEDETIFEEVKGRVAESPHQIKRQVSPEIECVSGSESLTLTEQQKMLEELTKQIEEQERQLVEQEEALRQQRAAVGVSLAHFSVSDALMSPPLKPFIVNSTLLQTSRKEELAKTAAAPVINQRRDPRQSKYPQQAAANQKITSDRTGKDSDAEVSVEHTSLELDDISQSPVVKPPETVYFDSSEVFKTPLEEKIDPGIQVDFIRDNALEQKIKNTSLDDNDSRPSANWQNDASILKDKELSSHQSNHPEQFQTPSVSESIQMPHCRILQTQTSQQSSELPGISHDVTLSNICMPDTYEYTMPSGSPNFKGSEEVPHSVPSQSELKSFSMQESTVLREESDHTQFRDSKFRPSASCPAYQNRRGEKMHTDNPCRRSAMLVPRAHRPSSPVGQKRSPAKFELTRSSFLHNNTGQRDLSPDRSVEDSCSPPPLDVQNDSHQQSPFFNHSSSGRPHIRQIHNRVPQLTNLHDSRGRLRHHRFIDHRSQKLPLGMPRLPNDQQCNSVSNQQHTEINQGQTTHIYRENRGSSQTQYMRPVDEIVRQRFHPPQDLSAQREPYPYPHNQRVPLGKYRGSSENQKGSQLSSLKRQRRLPSSQSGGPQDNQDNFTDSGGQLKFGFDDQHNRLVERPLRHCGPLLPTPTEGPIVLTHNMGNRHDYPREDWRHSSDMRSGVRADSNVHDSQSRTRMFRGYDHDEVEGQDPSCLSVESQLEYSEDRSREWDVSYSRLWDRNSRKYREREQKQDCSRGRELERFTDRDDNDKRDQDCERGRGRHRDWNRRDKERSRIRDRNEDQQCDRYFTDERRVQSRNRDRRRHRERDDGREKGYDIEEDWN